MWNANASNTIYTVYLTCIWHDHGANKDKLQITVASRIKRVKLTRIRLSCVLDTVKYVLNSLQVSEYSAMNISAVNIFLKSTAHRWESSKLQNLYDESLYLDIFTYWWTFRCFHLAKICGIQTCRIQLLPCLVDSSSYE